MNTKLHLPGPDAPSALLREMAEVPALIRQFNPTVFDTWRQVLTQKKAAFITGEGSSRIFPAKNLTTRARQLDLPVYLSTEGARQAAQYAHNRHMVIGLSNTSVSGFAAQRHRHTCYYRHTGKPINSHSHTCACFNVRRRTSRGRQ